ncbi:MAG TPA: NAD(P)/FAD-dependent oxidoreductase [Pirellulales bacterium]|nr:NAD(P)/FAD-dependent oxidoreductase [Pirellulales bacterium]
MTLAAMPALSCEAIVIGAGPAGAMAARELARRGIDVLLVERKLFPRAKVCGACLNERAVSWLRLAGLSNLLPRLGAVRTERFRASCGRRSVEIELPGGAALSRETFDQALAQAAVEAGGRLVTGVVATVRETMPGSSTREVTLRDGAGQARTISAKTVLSADGLGHPALARCREFVSRVSPHAKIGMRARIVNRVDRFKPGTIYMAAGKGGYVGLVRVEDGSLNLAAAIEPQAVKRAGSPAAAVSSILMASGMPEVDVTAAAWQGTLPLTQRTVRPVGHRVFLLGDAAGYVEPFTGEGMAWALASGIAVADFVERGLDDWCPRLEQEWLATYHRLIRNRQFWCRAFAAMLRKPAVVGAAVRLASAWPALCRPIVASLNRPAQPLELCHT